MRLRRDRRGSVAMMTGLLALPLLGLVGLAIDFGSATAAKAQLDLAADAAALLATTAASNAYLAGAADPITPAQDAASQRFKAQAGTQAGVSVGAVTVAVHQSGTRFSADVSYQGGVATTLGQLFGVLNMTVAGTASSSLSINPYIDVSVLMDVSSSMSVAATPDAMDAMENLTQKSGFRGGGERCAFACHWTDAHSNPAGDDYYGISRLNNIPLRVDVMRDAVGNLVSNIAALDTQSGFRLGLYTFAHDFNSIYPLSGDIGGASAVLPRIAPHVDTCNDQTTCPDTYPMAALNSFAAQAGTSGDGSSQATSQKFLFIVSDGVTDEWSDNGRSVTPLALPPCAAIKARGITVLTLYTPYLPLLNPYNDAYHRYVAPIQDQVPTAMRACATVPTMFFQAANAGDIDTQLKLMLASVIKTSGHLVR